MSKKLNNFNKGMFDDIKMKIRCSDVSEMVQYNNDYVFGLENLYHLHMKVGMRETTKIIFSGDSTTAGYGLAAPDFYKPDNIFKYTLLKEGIYCTDIVNKGVLGACTAHWCNTYVDEEIALKPDCIILRWGLNDPSYDNNLNLLAEDGGNKDIRRTPKDFKISLEAGLRKLRNYKNMNELTIILMTPNSTSTDLSFRNESWHESINVIIRELARKYDCVFLDTYRYLQDVRNVPFMDVVGDGHIHPLDMMNVWINDLLFDACFKRTYLHMYTMFRVWEDMQVQQFSNNWVASTVYTRPQFRWLDYNTIELRGFIHCGSLITLDEIFALPVTNRSSTLQIAPVMTELGLGCLNIEHLKLKVGTMPEGLASANWVCLDGVRIFLE